MAFAFGRGARDQVVRNIANLRTFEHGGIAGRQGPCRRLKALPTAYRHGLDNAVYVVYCYGTPIAWVTMADDATEEGRVNFMPDWQYSPTTTYYQGLVWEAWGDKIADPNPRYSKQKNRGTPRGRLSDVRYNRGNARAEAQARFAESEARRVVRREAEPQETHYSRLGAEESARERMARLLDPRYADPEWTPEPLHPDAEQRDWERVRADQGRRYPAHP